MCVCVSCEHAFDGKDVGGPGNGEEMLSRRRRPLLPRGPRPELGTHRTGGDKYQRVPPL